MVKIVLTRYETDGYSYGYDIQECFLYESVESARRDFLACIKKAKEKNNAYKKWLKELVSRQKSKLVPRKKAPPTGDTFTFAGIQFSLDDCVKKPDIQSLEDWFLSKCKENEENLEVK